MTSNRLSFFGKGITCIDRLDNDIPHLKSNCRLTTLYANCSRGDRERHCGFDIIDELTNDDDWQILFPAGV